MNRSLLSIRTRSCIVRPNIFFHPFTLTDTSGNLNGSTSESSSDSSSDDDDDDEGRAHEALALAACRMNAKRKVCEANVKKVEGELREKVRFYTVSAGILWLEDEEQVVGLAFQALDACGYTTDVPIHPEECKSSAELAVRKRILNAVTTTVSQNRRDLTSNVRLL